MDLLEPGTHVGESMIVRVIGIGSMATVYEVLHRRARRALKVVDGTIVGKSSTVPARLAQEGEAIAMVDHVNVVRWYKSGIDEERVWILLEYVEGPNLRELMTAAGGRLPFERAVALARHVCEGLVAVHRKGIVHRDVKPENILVTADDIAKIADFGTAKLPGWGVKTTKNTRRQMLSLYTAPELWLEGPFDPQADVYSMGLILFEAIAGVHPVVSPTAGPLAACERHLQYVPPPLSMMIDVPSDLSDLVQRAIVKDPARRCTMRELADGLEKVLDRLRAPRRAAARNVLPADQSRELAPTGSMAARPSVVAPAAVAAMAESTGLGPRGTIPMPPPSPSATAGAARSEMPVVEPRDETYDTDRAAAPPPAPSEPSSVPATLRTLSRPAPSLPVVPAPELEGARGSTAIPVESSARPSAAKPWKRAVQVVGAAGVLGVLGWWTLFERTPGSAPRPAAPPPSASVSPPPSASVPRPSPSSAPSSPSSRRAPKPLPATPRR